MLRTNAPLTDSTVRRTGRRSKLIWMVEVVEPTPSVLATLAENLSDGVYSLFPEPLPNRITASRYSRSRTLHTDTTPRHAHRCCPCSRAAVGSVPRRDAPWLAGRRPTSAAPSASGISSLDRVLNPGIKFHRPVVRAVRVVPIDATQFVHDVAAAQNQDSALPQRLNLAAEFEMLFETAALIEAQLKRRNIHPGIKMPQHAPRTVIQAHRYYITADQPYRGCNKSGSATQDTAR